MTFEYELTGFLDWLSESRRLAKERRINQAKKPYRQNSPQGEENGKAYRQNLQSLPANPAGINKEVEQLSFSNEKELSLSGKTQESSKPKSQNKKPNYTEAFEGFWQQYPKTNSTKKKAFEQWNRLDEADRQLAVDSLTGYLAHLRENQWRQAKAADGYLKTRMFDDFADKRPQVKPEEYSRNNWQEFCQLAARTGRWPAEWGPAPGHPSCNVPAELVTPELVSALNGRGCAA